MNKTQEVILLLEKLIDKAESEKSRAVKNLSNANTNYLRGFHKGYKYAMKKVSWWLEEELQELDWSEEE